MPFSNVKASRRGFTILEVMISVTALTVVSVGMNQGLKIASDSHRSVSSGARDNQSLRDSVSVLREELKSSRDDLITVLADNEGNTILTFQVPVEVLGEPLWGAYERGLGALGEQWSQPDWSHRYQVQVGVHGDRELLRQLLDEVGEVRYEEILVGDLRAGNDPLSPGFKVESVGDVWVATLATKREVGHGNRTETLHVRTRN